MLALVSHIHLQILHPLFFLIDLLLQPSFLPQNGSNVQFDIDIGVLGHWLGRHFLLHFLGDLLLDLFLDSREVGWPFRGLELELLLFVFVVVLPDVVLDVFAPDILLLLDLFEILLAFGSRIGLEAHFYLLYLRHQLRFWLGEIEGLDDSGSLLILDILDILLTVDGAPLEATTSGILTHLANQFITLLLPFDEFRDQFAL